ncbi:hypothetical protein BDC45DRAFT_432833, partial [Circinella umbellata]
NTQASSVLLPCLILILKPNMRVTVKLLQKEEKESNSMQSQKEPQNDKNTIITLASSTFLGSTREKENSIMLAKIGNLEPVTLMSRNAKNYYFIMSSNNIGEVLVDQPFGP